MASTCRSNQSFAAWLVAQSKGPARTAPASASGQVSRIDCPDDTTPHMNAHMGANQVTGFKSVSTASSDGACDRAEGGETKTIRKG
jgi:hypothetical protein